MARVNCSIQIPLFLPGATQYYFRQFVFPMIFVFGIVGNVLNLIVLKRMKTKSNLFLSLIAVADLCFFFPSFILNLAVYDNLSSSQTFLRFYYDALLTLTALRNWFSSASIWFAVMVTIERLIAIKTPLKAHIFWNKIRLSLVIIAIWVFTCVLQLPQFFGHFVQVKPDCNDFTKSTFMLRPIPLTHKHYTLIKMLYSTLPVIIVIIPMILLVVLNIFLIHYLRVNNKSLVMLGVSSCNSYTIERKVTKRILFVLIICFIFNFPSAVLMLWTILEKNKIVWKILVDIPAFLSTILVTLSKTTNFVIYCCVNDNFRKQLKLLVVEFCDFLSLKKSKNEAKTSQNCWKFSETTFLSNGHMNRTDAVHYMDQLEIITLIQ